MQGDGSESGSPRVLLTETRRVLGAQQRLVQRQRARATNVVRILLTAYGLVLTLASLATTLDIAGNGPPTSSPLGTAGLGHVAIPVIGVVLTVLTCRMLCAALVVLEPRTRQHSLVIRLTTPLLAQLRALASGGPPSDGQPRPAVAAGLTFRSGLDADATTGLADSDTPIRDVVSYNAGCVAGNARLVEQNRWYLTRVYRSAVVGVAVVAVTLIGSIGVLVATTGG